MPIHDWARVDAAIFHHFHQRWIVAHTDVLNERLLSREYYALDEQQGAGFDHDVSTLKAIGTPDREPDPSETNLDFYRRKQNVVAVRDVSGDQLVAIVEILSIGNKSSGKAFDDFVRKAAEFLSHQVHLLILDLQAVTPRDPQGIHGAIWNEVAGVPYVRPDDKPLTLAAYESGAVVQAFVEPIDVGDLLVNMPLFLQRGRYVAMPLEETYQAAFAAVPRRWRTVLESP